MLLHVFRRFRGDIRHRIPPKTVHYLYEVGGDQATP